MLWLCCVGVMQLCVLCVCVVCGMFIRSCRLFLLNLMVVLMIRLGSVMQFLFFWFSLVRNIFFSGNWCISLVGRYGVVFRGVGVVMKVMLCLLWNWLLIIMFKGYMLGFVGLFSVQCCMLMVWLFIRKFLLNCRDLLFCVWV